MLRRPGIESGSDFEPTIKTDRQESGYENNVIPFPQPEINNTKPKSGSHAESMAILESMGYKNFREAEQAIPQTAQEAERLSRIIKITKATASKEGINLYPPEAEEEQQAAAKAA